MPITTNSLVARMGFIVDPVTVVYNYGRQVDWSRVPSSFTNSDSVKFIPGGQAVSKTGDDKIIPVHTLTLTSLAVASNVATATLANHGLKVGDVINVAGSSLSYANGRKVVTGVPTANTFTYDADGADDTSSGTVTITFVAHGFIATPARENSKTDSYSGYGMIIGGVLYENLLPDAVGGPPALLPDQIKEDLSATGVSTGFVFEIYSDSRAN